MEDLTDLVKQYTIKHDRLLKSICAPLKEAFGIDSFIYYIIEEDGRFGILSNHAEQAECYYTEELYLKNPFMVHPKLLRSGCALVPAITDPCFQELFREQFQIHYLLLITKRTGNAIECFLFSSKELNPHTCAEFFAKSDVLHKFTLYFKRKAEALITEMLSDGFNLKEAKGGAFFKHDPLTPLSNHNGATLKFLKTVFPLSIREEECLELFKQGKSSQSTAATLGLSQRTVEHYFDNIKDKLGCSSKWELLEY
jgi:DNA-binding CsgD family transcriptional regulator